MNRRGLFRPSAMVEALSILMALRFFSQGLVPMVEGTGEPYGLSRGVVTGAERAGGAINPPRNIDPDMRSMPALSQVTGTPAPSSLDSNDTMNKEMGTVLDTIKCDNGVYRYELISGLRLSDATYSSPNADIMQSDEIPEESLKNCLNHCLSDGTNKNTNNKKNCTAIDVVFGERLSQYSSRSREFQPTKCIFDNPDLQNSNYKKDPDFKLFRKTCFPMSDECPESMYIMQDYLGLSFLPENKQTIITPTIQQCKERCLTKNQEIDSNFICRGGSYNKVTKECFLTSITWRSDSSRFRPNLDFDYFENACHTYERRCGKTSFTRDMKNMLDGPHYVTSIKNVTLKVCQEKCVQYNAVPCRSILYEKDRRTCYLSPEDDQSQDLVQISSDNLEYYLLNCNEEVDMKIGRQQDSGSSNTDTQFLSQRDFRPVQTAFQLYRQSFLDVPYRFGDVVKDRRVGISLATCLDECLETTGFNCRSVLYAESNRTCILSDKDTNNGNLIPNREFNYYAKTIDGAASTNNPFSGGSNTFQAGPGSAGQTGLFRPGNNGRFIGTVNGGNSFGGSNQFRPISFNENRNDRFGGSFGGSQGSFTGFRGFSGDNSIRDPNNFRFADSGGIGSSNRFNSDFGGSGQGSGAFGSGASGSGAFGSGASGSGAFGSGASGSGAFGSGASGSGASGFIIRSGGQRFGDTRSTGFRNSGGFTQDSNSLFGDRFSSRGTTNRFSLQNDGDSFNNRFSFNDRFGNTRNPNSIFSGNDLEASQNERTFRVSHGRTDGTMVPMEGAVSQVCNEDGSMEFRLRTTNPFYGRIYTNKYYNRCYFRGGGGTTNYLKISAPGSSPDCGAALSGDTSTVIVTIQIDDNVMTKADRRYNLTCTTIGPQGSTVTSGYIGAGSGAPIPIEHLPETARLESRVNLQILYKGRPTTTVAVGDPLTFKLVSQDGSRLVSDIFATNVIARDPYTDRQVKLIDGRGCPVNDFIFPALAKRRSNTLESEFNAFMIPEATVLIFQADVNSCKGPCEPVSCFINNGRSEVESYGRRKRETNQTEEVEEVEEEEPMYEYDEHYMNHLGLPEGVDIDGPQEHIVGVYEVFMNREDIPEYESLTSNEEVCIKETEYYGMISTLSICIIALFIALGTTAYLYKKQHSLNAKNANADASNPRASTSERKSLPSVSFPGVDVRSVSQTPRYLPDCASLQNSSKFKENEKGKEGQVDPSEPIYTNPSLFERV